MTNLTIEDLRVIRNALSNRIDHLRAKIDEADDTNQKMDLELMIKETLDTKRKVRIKIVEMTQMQMKEKENNNHMAQEIARVMELRSPRS